jgi:L-amino acid N-acyltransferase YncA
MGDLTIRKACEEDAQIVSEIYNWYVLNTAVTFETEAVEIAEIKRRIREKLATHDWLVAEINQQIVGYAYYRSFRPRAAYGHTVESTIYLSANSVGKGFGRALYDALVRSARERGFRELIGVIALPNPGSVALHSSLGFREVGVLRAVGNKFGKYVDVALWQRSVESAERKSS